jgi:hypothetical protein
LEDDYQPHSLSLNRDVFQQNGQDWDLFKRINKYMQFNLNNNSEVNRSRLDFPCY